MSLRLRLVVLSLALAGGLFALNPRRALTQYTRTVWTQAQGLPQDTIRAITQTDDGYLWLGTDEGLAQLRRLRFRDLLPRTTDRYQVTPSPLSGPAAAERCGLGRPMG